MNNRRTVVVGARSALNRRLRVDQHPGVTTSLAEPAKGDSLPALVPPTRVRPRPTLRRKSSGRPVGTAPSGNPIVAGSPTVAGSPPALEPTIPPPPVLPWDLARPGGRTRRRITAGLIFGLPCALYLTVGWILVFTYASYNGDAQARLANAYYVLFSRDPHLAAIGFVWNPLPSLSVMPLLSLKALWPALTTHAFAGNIMSAIFMAGAVYQMYEFLRDLGLGSVTRTALVAVFALNPMIVYYGANGMSEGIFIFTLLVATRYLARWLRDDRVIWLVLSASALGLAYLARNEAAFAAFFAAGTVVVVSFVRCRSVSRERIYRALIDGFIFSLPFAVCFVGWAAVSWIIVGHPFEQFQSVYGTASQLRVINQANPVHLTKGQAASRALHAANSMAPLLPIVAFLAVLAAARKRDLRVLAPLTMPGGVLLFAVLAYTVGQTAGWYRYYIMAVPLFVLLLGSLIAGVVGSRSYPGIFASKLARPRVGPVLRGGAILVGLSLAAANIPTTGATLYHSAVASEEQLHLNYIFHPVKRNSGEAAERDRYASTAKIAAALDHLHLPHGGLLVDNFTPCVPFIILDSAHPQQFIIPNDEDFQQALADPVTFHVHFLMAPQGSGYGSLDAVNRQYPTLYSDGAGISSPVSSFDFPGCPLLTLFKINTPGPA